MLRAEGEALGIATVVQAIKDAGVDEKVLAYQQLQLLPRLAEGTANKVWFVPTDVSAHLETAKRLLQGEGPAAERAAALTRAPLRSTRRRLGHTSPSD